MLVALCLFRVLNCLSTYSIIEKEIKSQCVIELFKIKRLECQLHKLQFIFFHVIVNVKLLSQLPPVPS